MTISELRLLNDRARVVVIYRLALNPQSLQVGATVTNRPGVVRLKLDKRILPAKVDSLIIRSNGSGGLQATARGGAITFGVEIEREGKEVQE